LKKRLVAVVEYFPPRLGADRRIFELLRRLSHKYDIHFLVLPPSYLLFIRTIGENAESNNNIIDHNMVGHSLRLPLFLHKLWAKGFVLSFALSFIYLQFLALKKMIEIKPDVVIINNTSVYTGFTGFVCSKLLSRNLIVEYNDLQALYTIELVRNKVGGSLLSILGKILIAVEDMIVRNGWKVTAITSFIRDYARARNTRSDIVLIPDGVDTDVFDPFKINGAAIRSKFDIEKETLLCVYAGRIEECAGAGIVLETAELLEKRKEVVFLIVGEGDLNIINRFSKFGNVILAGRVEKDDVPRYLAAADVVLVPFPDSIASHSISPLKLFEALAMQKIVIASAVSGIGEVVQSGLKFVRVRGSPALWASEIEKMLENRGSEQESAATNREIIIKRYDWDHLAEAFGNVIEDKDSSSLL
jgi:glycosyltransferase involved in cell wall biosynthesis